MQQQNAYVMQQQQKQQYSNNSFFFISTPTFKKGKYAEHTLNLLSIVNVSWHVPDDFLTKTVKCSSKHLKKKKKPLLHPQTCMHINRDTMVIS